jgi:uncharacterized membrane protein HdeD (DUF308 family)
MTTAASAVQVQTKQHPWWLTLISGILAMIIGAALLWGNFTTKVDLYMFLITFLGIWWMIEGVIDIVGIFIDHSMWGWKLFIGIISLVAGFYIVSYPVVSAVVMPRVFVLVLGLWGLIYGVILLIMAFQGGGWGAGILGGLGIVFGLALMASYFDYVVLGLGLAMVWTAALFAFVGGGVMIFRAFKQRSA